MIVIPGLKTFETNLHHIGAQRQAAPEVVEDSEPRDGVDASEKFQRLPNRPVFSKPQPRSTPMSREEMDEVKAYVQLRADRDKFLSGLWKIMQEAQNSVLEIFLGAMLHRAEVMDKMLAEWDDSLMAQE